MKLMNFYLTKPSKAPKRIKVKTIKEIISKNIDYMESSKATVNLNLVVFNFSCIYMYQLEILSLARFVN